VGAAEAVRARRGGGGLGVEGPKKKKKIRREWVQPDPSRKGSHWYTHNGSQLIVSVGAGRPLPGFIWGRGGIFAMILSGFKLHITPMPSTCVESVINYSPHGSVPQCTVHFYRDKIGIGVTKSCMA
jgi:hypothetical protein